MTCERLPFIPDTPNDDLVLLHQFHVFETYSLHSHEFYEVFYVVRGQAMHEVNGSAQVVGEGSLVFIRPDDKHCYRYLARSDFEFINVNITLELTDQTFAYLRLPRAEFDAPALPPTVHLTGARHAEMRYKFTELASMAPGPARRQVFCSILPEVLLTLRAGQNPRDAQVIPRWLSDVLLRLDQPACFTQGLPELLRMTSYTQEHLTRSFRRYVHMSPTAYINQKRLGYAAELLAAGEIAPPEVANRAGFNNLSHFYHLFRQQYGCTPLQFSQQYREEQAGQVACLARISRDAAYSAMRPGAVRIPLEGGLFAYCLRDGSTDIYVSFAADATEHSLSELNTCWDPRLSGGATVHVNGENPTLLQYLCSKHGVRPVREGRELTLTRKAFDALPEPVLPAGTTIAPCPPERLTQCLALLCAALPAPIDENQLRIELDAAALQCRLHCAEQAGKLCGVAWSAGNEVRCVVVDAAFRGQGIGRTLLHQSVRSALTGDIESCMLRLPDGADSGFPRVLGFALTAHEAVLRL